MKTILLLVITVALAAMGRAQLSFETSRATQSFTGQFIVYASAGVGQPSRVLRSQDCIQLSPSVLVASCERMKQLLWRELGAEPSWRGKIFINLHPARSEDDNVTIVSERFADGWQYRVQLPDILHRDRYVRVMTQVLLMEIANRGSSDRSVELPLWLVEGLSQELVALNRREKFILEEPTRSVNGIRFSSGPAVADVVWTNTLGYAHQILLAYAPLTFEQLSWPSDDQLSGGAGAVYQGSAQLFVNRLLRFEDGEACLRAMMSDLPNHLNWQLAFYTGFKSHFERPLDVEKWWAVQVAEFVGRDLTRTWSLAESWDKLDQILRAPAEVRTSENELPLRTRVKLQALLRDSNNIEQAAFYRQKLSQLEALRVRVSQDMIGLVDDYRDAIGIYLRKQWTTSPFVPLGKQGALMTNPAANELARKLDALDQRRMAMRPKEKQRDANPVAPISGAALN